MNVVHVAHILCKCAPSCRQEATSYDGAYGRTLTDPEAYWDDLVSPFGAAWNENEIPVDSKPYLQLRAKSNGLGKPMLCQTRPCNICESNGYRRSVVGRFSETEAALLNP